jgi:hypothetical protein
MLFDLRRREGVGLFALRLVEFLLSLIHESLRVCLCLCAGLAYLHTIAALGVAHGITQMWDAFYILHLFLAGKAISVVRPRLAVPLPGEGNRAMRLPHTPAQGS